MSRLLFLLGPLLGGMLFSIGLGVSGMTEASNIIGFLDITGKWNPALIFVMCGALVVNIVLYRLIIKRKKPLMEKSFFVPTNSMIDRRLIVGAVLFGLGWGLTGLCPGPGIVSLVSGTSYGFSFFTSMIVGMFFAQKVILK